MCSFESGLQKAGSVTCNEFAACVLLCSFYCCSFTVQVPPEGVAVGQQRTRVASVSVFVIFCYLFVVQVFFCSRDVGACPVTTDLSFGDKSIREKQTIVGDVHGGV